jgi:hypothetical protein
MIEQTLESTLVLFLFHCSENIELFKNTVMARVKNGFQKLRANSLSAIWSVLSRGRVR